MTPRGPQFEVGDLVEDDTGRTGVIVCTYYADRDLAEVIAVRFEDCPISLAAQTSTSTLRKRGTSS